MMCVTFNSNHIICFSHTNARDETNIPIFYKLSLFVWNIAKHNVIIDSEMTTQFLQMQK